MRKRISVAMILICSALAGGGGAATADVFQEIDTRHRRGELDERTRQLYRVAAVKRPSLLPRELRERLGSPAWRSGTAVLVEAFQWVERRGEQGGAVHRLLSPPTDFDYVVESTTRPIRVSYGQTSLQGYAEAILDAAEISWDIQVDEYGFFPPPIEPGTEPYRFYVGETSPGVAGYTSPYDPNPDTPWADCYTYIFISPDLGIGRVASTVAHEFNHALQAAMDCAEVTTYWENTATYIQAATFPELRYDSYWTMYSFQAVPWWSLDRFDPGQGYQYGGALLNYFLADAYAPGEGPVLIRDIWAASMQPAPTDNGMFVNSLTYFDGIETALADRGFNDTMEEVYLDFSESRYFVGSNADDDHIDIADEFGWFSTLQITADHYQGQLPLEGQAPPPERRPAPYGANHIKLALGADYPYTVQVRFDGADDTRWAVRVVRMGGGLPSLAEDLAVDPASGEGELEVGAGEYPTLMLVVANLGTEDYKPGISPGGGADYTYGFVPIIPPPVLEALAPAEVAAGQQNVLMRLTGSGFVSGSGFALRFDDPLLEVSSIRYVEETEVVFDLTVPAITEPGLKSITVTNHGGVEATGVDLLTVVETESDEPKSGCGCRSGGADSPVGVLPLVLLWVMRRRRP
ncbi:MAG: DUF6055 domain-containing protein [bacterium]